MKRGPKPKWTSDDLARIADLRDKGFTQQEIARVMGTGQQQVSRLLGEIKRQQTVIETHDTETMAADPEGFLRALGSPLKALRAVNVPNDPELRDALSEAYRAAYETKD